MGDAYFKTRVPGVCIIFFCILDPFHHSMYLLYMQEQLSKPRQEHHQLLTVPFFLDVSFRKNMVGKLCFRSLYVRVPV